MTIEKCSSIFDTYILIENLPLPRTTSMESPFSNNISPPHMNKIFEKRNEHTYNLRQKPQFSRPLVKSVYYGTETLSHLEPKAWNILPNIYKKYRWSKQIQKGYENLAELKEVH